MKAKDLIDILKVNPDADVLVSAQFKQETRYGYTYHESEPQLLHHTESFKDKIIFVGRVDEE